MAMPRCAATGMPRRRRGWSPEVAWGAPARRSSGRTVPTAWWKPPPPSAPIAGDTGVRAPPAAPAAAPASTVAGCDSYASWYDAQVAYEAAGMTAADPAVVAALDPDYDGIACEEGM